MWEDTVRSPSTRITPGVFYLVRALFCTRPWSPGRGSGGFRLLRAWQPRPAGHRQRKYEQTDKVRCGPGSGSICSPREADGSGWLQRTDPRRGGTQRTSQDWAESKCPITFFFFFFFFNFIYVERREREQRRGRKTERESQAGCALSAQSPRWGSNSQTRRP